MEEMTMGKRIAALRKRAGLTQEQLAERVGVSPQAVSKWENDQSCPDISLIPELAEIFGVSCDELLGKEKISEDKPEKEEKESMKKKTIQLSLDVGGIMFPIAVLIFGVELFLRWKFNIDVSVWNLIWTDAVFCIGIGMAISRISPFAVGLAAVGAYFALRYFGVIHTIATWQAILAILLVLWAITMLIDKFVPKKSKHYAGSKKEKYECSEEGGIIKCSCAFCDRKAYLFTDTIHGGNVNLSFGELKLDLRDCKHTTPETLNLNASFGELTVYIPSNMRVILDHSASFGSVEVIGEPSENAPEELHISARASFGQINIEY